MNAILGAFAQKDWMGSITGADAADWVTVAAYAIAAVIALAAALHAGQLVRPAREERFWVGTALLMIAFGINEIFDFQTIVTVAGRTLAFEQGWYDQRRVYQAEFIVALAVGALVLGALLLRLTRATHRTVRIALLGLVFIGAFVLVRAASFHHISDLLGMGPDGFPIGSMQEMAGIVIVAAAAWSYTRIRATRRKPATGRSPPGRAEPQAPPPADASTPL